jgi:FKBP12-rapamycin complex-associated protein
VPGTYHASKPVEPIARFSRTLKVIASKQRPRKLTLYGSDAHVYSYLLKGHEDLRQDERVMQLFGLVNALLKHDSRTQAHDHAIERYAVIPLSANSGVIGWVPHSDTMHQLIRDYRQQRQIVLNLEHRVMQKIAPDYDKLPLVQRVEVFSEAMDETSGNDLERILWLRAENSEQWMLRRALFTRSLAVMSMVGHILGLGDRHPSNLMLDRHTGHVIHIDFVRPRSVLLLCV